jgi:hypothetical protein
MKVRGDTAALSEPEALKTRTAPWTSVLSNRVVDHRPLRTFEVQSGTKEGWVSCPALDALRRRSYFLSCRAPAELGEALQLKIYDRLRTEPASKRTRQFLAQRVSRL